MSTKRIIAVCLLSLTALSAWAAPTFVNVERGVSGQGASSVDVTINGVTSGNTLIVAVGLSAASSTTCTTSGLTWTREINQTHAVGDTLDIHSAYVASGGNITVHITVATPTVLRVIICEYSGIASSSRVQDSSSASATSGSVNAGSVTATDNNLIFCAAKTDSDLQGWVAGSGFTIRNTPNAELEPDQKLGVEDKTVSSGTYSGTFTITSDSWAAGVVAYSESPVGEAAVEPVASPIGGPYYGSQNVVLSSTSPSPTIYYTINGTTPTTSSSVYSTPIPITSTTTIKAFATSSGLTDSTVLTAVYELGSWSSSASTFKSMVIPQQTGTFTMSFDVTPSSSSAFTAISLSPNGIDDPTDNAITIFFTDTSVVQARNGGAYASVNTIPYSASNVYHIVINGNVTTRTYDATVNGTVLASNYAFRTEQAAATELDHMGFYTVTGTTVVSNLSIGSSSSGSVNCNTINVTNLRIGQ